MQLKNYITQYFIPYYIQKKLQNQKKELNKINIIQSYNLVNLDIDKILSSDIELFLLSLEKDRDISKSTVNRYRSTLSSIFNYALENDIIKKNPIKKIKKYKEYHRSRYLTEIEIERLLSACRESTNSELYSITVLALNTGMRIGEILNLRKFNVCNDFIILQDKQTKTGLPRKIPLNNVANCIINIYLSKTINQTDKLFTSKYIRRQFHKARERAELDDVRFHDLRRTFATHLKDRCVDIHTISKILGHTTIRTTEIYLGVNDRKLLDSVKILCFN